MNKPDVKEKINKKKSKKKKGFFRENIESILIAIALAFVLRIFVVEAFKIPTGSMAPTLLGQHKSVKCPNCGWKFKSNHNIAYVKCSNCFYKIHIADYGKRGGNRILVNKFIYDFGKPKRWDVAVFKYPFDDVICLSCGYSESKSMICEKCDNSMKRENYFKSKINSVKRSFGIKQYHKVVCKSCDTVSAITCDQCGSSNVHVIRKNYIKRLIGLPEEQLQIANGDIYINNSIQRKPDKVQGALWVPVYDSSYSAKQEIVKNWSTNDEFWNISENQLQLTLPEGSEERSYVTFNREITDYSVYNSELDSAITGDIMVRFDVINSGNSGGISIILEENEKVIEAFIRSGGEKAVSQLTISGSVVETNPEVFLEQKKEYRVELSNVDNKIVLKLNGSKIFSHLFDTELSSIGDYTEFSRVKFGGVSRDAVFKNISIFRDVYYTETGKWGTAEAVEIGEKEYYFLGDNSRNSNDSRYWKIVPESNMVGRAFMVFWPVPTIKIVR